MIKIINLRNPKHFLDTYLQFVKLLLSFLFSSIQIFFYFISILYKTHLLQQSNMFSRHLVSWRSISILFRFEIWQGFGSWSNIALINFMPSNDSINSTFVKEISQRVASYSFILFWFSIQIPFKLLNRLRKYFQKFFDIKVCRVLFLLFSLFKFR